MKTKRGWNFGEFEITRREIIASISIIAIMLLIGTLISSKISDWQINQNDKYNKAVKIESTDLFQYGMETNIGNSSGMHGVFFFYFLNINVFATDFGVSNCIYSL